MSVAKVNNLGLDVPRPRWEEYTTCTAVAPDAVFTVRRYGDTGQLYDPIWCADSLTNSQEPAGQRDEPAESP